MERKWILAPKIEANDNGIAWEEICGVSCIAQILKRRGFRNADEVQAFLRPQLRALRDPFEMVQMQKAVDRIFQAIDQGERIVLFGDYDVDGVTSLALLDEVLRAFGAKPGIFLPLRMEEGYGLSREGLERCCAEFDPQLLIALDCGTSSIREIAELTARDVEVIVIDHHEPKSELPGCVALVNPKANGDENALSLCTVGLVFKLSHALLKVRPLPGFDLREQLDLVALGTVADIVPIEHENRIFVYRGSRQISVSKRPGLRQLIALAGVKETVSPEDIGFRLGPRLNAAGRLTTAEKALRLLLTTDTDEAGELAAVLDQQNRERQQVEKQIFLAADEETQKQHDPGRDAAIVVAGERWHPGVLGIVASRLVRKYHRPAIVIGFDGNGLGKGSGRSIAGLSLVQALGECSALLEKFGGHEMAAGITLSREKMPAFRKAFLDAARALLSDDDLQPRLGLDHELAFHELDHHLLRWHEALQPFGTGNLQPVFVAREVAPAVPPQILKEKHLVLRLKQGNRQQRAVFFDGAMEPLPEPPWDVAFRLQSDEYEGLIRLQMQVQAIRASAPLAC